MRHYKQTKVGTFFSRVIRRCIYSGYPNSDILPAAKQAEFEESLRLKNQFKSLDEDDVDFLDSVLESERAREDAVKKDTAEQLDAYRRQQAAANKVDLDKAIDPPKIEADNWTTKKRKKKEPDMPGLKIRKTFQSTPAPADDRPLPSPASGPQSTPDMKTDPKPVDKGRNNTPTTGNPASKPPVSTTPPTASSGLDLGDYGSDSD
jgi:hypothetical protein